MNQARIVRPFTLGVRISLVRNAALIIVTQLKESEKDRQVENGEFFGLISLVKILDINRRYLPVGV